MAQTYTDLFSPETLASFLELPEVQVARTKIDTQAHGSVSFTVPATPDVKVVLQERLGLDLRERATIPMRWIKGDTRPHIDTGSRAFDNTYLVYLTNSEGQLLVGENSYEMTENTAFVFPERLRHETVDTGDVPRLLLGPMSETGSPVGIFTINGNGGTTVYLRQDGADTQYSADQVTWNPVYWPCLLVNDSPGDGMLTFAFTTDITLTTVLSYFVCGSTHIQIGDRTLLQTGTVPTIHVVDIPNFPGFVVNGTNSENGFSNIAICNLFVSSSGTTTLDGFKGWIAQDYFASGATNNTIVNCSSNGVITNFAGGIIGAFCATNSGNLLLRGCTSSGNIAAADAGGITGAFCASQNGAVMNVEECSSSGDINGERAGGICGSSYGWENTTGMASVTRCYSTGTISGLFGGGICGYQAGRGGNATASNCYSSGDILLLGGGIFGGFAGSTLFLPGLATATNCYSTGTITSGGGVYGREYLNAIANNCYTTGAGLGGIWFGSDQDTLPGLGTNNYAEGNHSSSGWNDLNALTTLTGTPGVSPAGTSWISLGPNQPYRLRTIGFTPYLFTNITNTNTFTTTFSESVAAGSSGSAAILPGGYTYTIVAINNADPSTIPDISINSATGEIQTTTALAADTYTIVLQAEINPYSVTTVVLTVSGNVQPGPVPNFLVVPACCDTLPLIRPSPATNNSSEVITADKAGKVIVRNVNTYYDAIANRSVTYLAKPVFGSYREYMEYLQGQ